MQKKKKAILFHLGLFFPMKYYLCLFFKNPEYDLEAFI